MIRCHDRPTPNPAKIALFLAATRLLPRLLSSCPVSAPDCRQAPHPKCWHSEDGA
jgi:hypothetical protein